MNYRTIETRAISSPTETSIITYNAETQQVSVAGEPARQISAAENTLRFVGYHEDGPQTIRDEATAVHTGIANEATSIMEGADFTTRQIQGQIGAIRTQAEAVEPTKVRAEASASYIQQLLGALPPESAPVPAGTVPADYQGHPIDYSGDISRLDGRVANIVAQLQNLQHMSASAVRDSNEQLSGMSAHIGTLERELAEARAVSQATAAEEYNLKALFNEPGGARELGEKIDVLAEQLRRMADQYDRDSNEKATIMADLRQSEQEYFVLKSFVSQAHQDSRTMTQQLEAAFKAHGAVSGDLTPERITDIMSELEVLQYNERGVHSTFRGLSCRLQSIDEVRGPKEARVGTLITDMAQSEVKANELFTYAQQLAYALKAQIRKTDPIRQRLAVLRARLDQVEGRVLPDATKAQQETPAYPQQITHDSAPAIPRFGQITR